MLSHVKLRWYYHMFLRNRLSFYVASYKETGHLIGISRSVQWSMLNGHVQKYLTFKYKL